MNVVFTVLAAFAIGYAVKQRPIAILTYLVLDALVFTFQSVSVLLTWMAGGTPAAFGPGPSGSFPVSYSVSEMMGYGVINLVVTAVGVGLVVLGHRVAGRRATRREAVSVA